MEEKDLIKKSKKGDQEAFRQLMEKYQKRIFNSCFQILHDVEHTEDVVQEVFLTAYAKLNSFEGRSTFYTWLYKIAKNKALNALRKIHHEELPLKEEILSLAGPTEKEENGLKMDAIYDALQDLSPKQRIIFELFEFQKKAQKEIAADLNIPPGTVRSSLFYARKKIKKRMKL